MARRLPPNVTRNPVWNAATIAHALGTHKARIESIAKQLFGREYGEFTNEQNAQIRTVYNDTKIRY